MALADSQKISRVLSGQPFGDGRDGSLTISSNTTQSLTDESCSGSSGTTGLTTAGSTLSNDDIILIHQSRGTGVGNWEINKVASGGGTTSITLAENMANTYTDSGASQAQAIVIPMYTDIAVNNTYTWNGQDWNGNVGGFLIFACNGTANGSGSLNHAGTNGADNVNASTNYLNGRTGGGFYGGHHYRGGNQFTYRGEGTNGARVVGNNSGNAGGGGHGSVTGGSGGGSGGGGGNGTAGGTGGSTTYGDGYNGGAGTTAGSADLTTAVFGGGGGGGISDNAGAVGSGGSGGGAIFAFVKDFDMSSMAAVSLDGGDGGDGDYGMGGAAAGGSFLGECETINYGSGVVTADGGAGGVKDADEYGGDGGDGRIAVHYSGSVSGTTSPTLNSTQDATLVEIGLYPQIMTF